MNDEIRELLAKGEAHVGFDRAIEGVDLTSINEVRGHSLWQLLEHIRICQQDLLEYITKPDYAHDREWPADYWPDRDGDADSWHRSVQQSRDDRERMFAVVDDGDLLRPTPTAAQHSILRDLLVLADHNAYHLGQMVLIRQLLGNWG